MKVDGRVCKGNGKREVSGKEAVLELKKQRKVYTVILRYAVKIMTSYIKENKPDNIVY